MITIVLAHPWHGSFNKAIVDTLVSKYKEEGKECQIIDLHKDKFNPTYEEKDLANYNKGITDDPIVLKYQEMLKNTSHLIFVFPIWWGTMPAILKGFFDKVMLLNFAFNYENGWTPLLGIEKGTVITTSQSPTAMYRTVIEETFIPHIMGGIGVSNVSWFNCENVSKSERQHKTDFLVKLVQEI